MNENRCGSINDEIQLLKAEVLPFFHEHVDEFKTFVVDKLRQDNEASLWKLSVEFISFLNLPFNMKRYMETQTHKIRVCLQEKLVSGQNDCEIEPSVKQALVSEWIKCEAHQHRVNQINMQKQCLKQFKSEFEAALLNELCRCHIPEDLEDIIQHQASQINP